MEKKNWLIVAAIGLALILVGLVIKVKFFGKSGPAALQIATTPRSTVLIDDTQAGITPFFNDKLEPGEHTVKLLPEATNNSLIPWEGRVNLTANILTVINRNFAASETFSSGEIIWLEKISSGDKSALSVISIPDQAVIKVNNEPKGFAPVLIEDLPPGDYQVTVVAPGYEEKVVTARTIAGYKLIVNAQLAQRIEGMAEATTSAEIEEEEEKEIEEIKESPTPSPKTTPKATLAPPEKPYVKIKETPTGWLRVREKPSSGADSTELTKVNPGEMYSYLEEEENGWYKIEYEEGKEGWISGVYADLVE